MSNEGLLNGLDLTMYTDCGCSPNDVDVVETYDFVDNGKQTRPAGPVSSH